MPDLRERPLAHVAERVVPPHGVRVHVAEVVDVGDVHAGGIAAPLRELGAHVRLAFGKVPPHPEQQVDAVGIVVAGDELLGQAALLIVPAGVEQQVHRLARGLEMRVVLAVLVAAPGVVEVREVELVDAFVLRPARAAPAGRAALSCVSVKRRPTLMPRSRHRRMPASDASKAPSLRRKLSCVAAMPSRLMPT